jgi:hypothetical protein
MSNPNLRNDEDFIASCKEEQGSSDEPCRICASCEEPVAEKEAYVYNRHYYHPSCAAVARCSWCGEYGQKADGMMVIGPDGSIYHAQCWEMDVKPSREK